MEVASYIRQGKHLTELSLCYSCGGDEGVAVLAEALAGNETIKKFSLDDMKLSPDTLTAFAKALASNTTLEVLDIWKVCPVDKDKVLSLLKQERYANVFKRTSDPVARGAFAGAHHAHPQTSLLSEVVSHHDLWRSTSGCS
ncbi:hypothetical protein MTO96_023006 [Rhipicephalus appendiculatus]